MDLLMETGLIQPWGRKDAAGRPTLWVTTPRFLTQFGLKSLRDLPGAERYRPTAGARDRPAAVQEAPDAASTPDSGVSAASGS